MNRLYVVLGRIFAQSRSWFRATTERHRLESEMEEELAFHIEQLTADLMRAGQTPKAAHRNARIALGSTVVYKDQMRTSLGLRFADELSADIRYGVRRLRRSVGFAAIAAISLSLAIGANTAIFSFAHQLLYARLRVPHPEQLRVLRWDQDNRSVVQDMWGDFDPDDHGGMMGSIFSYPVYQQISKNLLFNGLIAFKEDPMNATIRGTAQQVDVEMVSGNYYSVLQVKPQLGRAIQPSDDAIAGSGAVAVISDALWEKAFDRSPNVLGQAIRLNQAVVTIVGVNPRGFTGAKNAQRSEDVFVPLSLQPVIDPKGKTSLLDDPDTWWLSVMGRAQPQTSDATAQSSLETELDAAIRATMTVKAGDTLPRLLVTDGSRGLRFPDARFARPIYVLLAMTGLVLLLACVNIANLLLASGTQRQREIGVRLAMGAGRRRILRQLLTESLLLASLGGLGGLAMAYLGRNLLPHLITNPWSTSRIEVGFSWSVFAFAGAVTLITGILFGLGPAWVATRTAVGANLKENSQAATQRRSGLASKGVVAFQIALSTLLVIGAALFLRTVFALNAVDPGFQTENLLLFQINPPGLRYGPGKDVELHRQLEQTLAALPGVQGVTLSLGPYIADGMSGSRVTLEGLHEAGQPGGDSFNTVGQSFFKTMGIPILMGRGIGPQDTATSTKIAVINRTMAKERFHDENPIGKRFKTDLSPDWLEIVGVCGDNRYRNLRDDPPPQFFLPLAQQTEVGSMTYAVRISSPVAQVIGSLVPELRRAVQHVDPDLPIIDVRTQQEQIAATESIERMIASLVAAFGLLALALACVGIYGVMAYSVANRSNEIGIRLALGAVPRQLLGMVLREATWISLAGVVVGLGSALALARLVKSMLYGMQPTDPVSLVAGSGLLIAVGLAASWIPARRASKLQPMEALRHE